MTPDNRHKHLVVRAEILNPPVNKTLLEKMFNLAGIRLCRWMSKFIKDIGMKAMFPPRARYCNKAGNRGMTAFSIIETSHIALHTWDECSPAILQFDVYTCSDLDLDQVLEELKVFNPTKIEFTFLDREHGLRTLAESRGAIKMQK